MPLQKASELQGRIKLQFVLGTGLPSRLIGWYGSDYGEGFSHVDAVMPNGFLLGARDDEVGGAKRGVHLRPQNYEKWRRCVQVVISCTLQEEKTWHNWLWDQLGKDYDQAAIWGFILGKPLHEEGTWICSACQFKALMKAGKLHNTDIPSSCVSPNSLYLLVTSGLGGIKHDLFEAHHDDDK